MTEEMLNEAMESSGLEVYAKPPAEIGDHEPTKTWEEYVSSWITIQDLKGASQWTLGDIANEVVRAFSGPGDKRGKVALEKFAESVGERKETVRQYAWVSRTFSSHADRQTDLSYSHYRATVKTEAPMVWIDTAVKENWTVARLIEEIKNVQDATSVEQGRPCDFCGTPIPETGAYHVRQNGLKIGCLCSARCGVGWFLEKAKQEEEQINANMEEAA